MRTARGCTFLLFLAAAAAGSSSGAGGEGWKPYANEKWGYSLEHPPDWTASVDVENEEGPARIVRQRVIFRNPDGVQVAVSVRENRSGASLEDWFAEYARPSWRDAAGLPARPNEQVAGKPAISFEIPSTGQAFGESIAIVKCGGLIFEVSYQDSDHGGSRDIYLLMLNSFAVTPRE